jgi:hypothetical protein
MRQPAGGTVHFAGLMNSSLTSTVVSGGSGLSRSRAK